MPLGRDSCLSQNRTSIRCLGVSLRPHNGQRIFMESESRQHEITRLAAFFLWEQRGCPFGTPEVDWFRAEEETRTQTEQPPGKPPLISAAETVGSVLGKVAALATSVVS